MPGTRNDMSRYLSDKITESFNENLKAPQVEEYKAFTTPKVSTKDEEIYGSFGNLLPAQEKIEGGPLHYDTAKEMFFTTVINKTYDRGVSATWEEVEDDPDKVLDKIHTEDMMRAMVVKREENVAAIVDGVFTSTGADGVAYAASNHPLDTGKTALTNDNLMTASDITPDAYIAGCNKFHAIKNYAGSLMRTRATAILAHADQQTKIQAIQSSNLKAQELSNTANTVAQLKQIYSTYINAYYWHLLDELIPSFIFQRRTGLLPLSEQDKIQTLNFYWAMVERYRAAQINPGFGHVSNAWTGA